MAKWVRSIRLRRMPCGRRISPSNGKSSRVGKSPAGRVIRVKRLRPQRTVALSPSTLSVTLASSGRARRMSCSLRAGRVVSPGVSTCSSTRTDSSISRSVVVRVSSRSRADTSTLVRIGSVCRRSTAPITCCSGLSSCSRLASSFIEVLRYACSFGLHRVRAGRPYFLLGHRVNKILPVRTT